MAGHRLSDRSNASDLFVCKPPAPVIEVRPAVKDDVVGLRHVNLGLRATA